MNCCGDGGKRKAKDWGDDSQGQKRVNMQVLPLIIIGLVGLGFIIYKFLI